ncbi:MAG: AAA-associated domain-containing protein, partial [Conexivisphaera sp.]
MASEAFPICVSPDHVMGLLGYLSGLGGVADADAVNRASGADLDILPHALRAAEMLGLVEADSGYIMLTKLGKRLSSESSSHARRELGEALSGLEPFREILHRLRERRALSREELLDILRNYHYWESEEDAERGFRCFLSWLLYAHLADYDPEKE